MLHHFLQVTSTHAFGQVFCNTRLSLLNVSLVVPPLTSDRAPGPVPCQRCPVKGALRCRAQAQCILHLAMVVQTDLIAGISVGAMVVPQGMSYAKLAGLPNVYGLYGAFVPVMIYAALGSSPQLVGVFHIVNVPSTLFLA